MMIANERERELLRESGRRLGSHLKRLSDMAIVGATPRELDAAARKMIADDGDIAPFADYPSGKHGEEFPGVVCISVNDAIVHAPGTTSHMPFVDGDVVKIDFGVSHQGFITDSARTVIVGKPRKEDAQLMRATYEALDAGIGAARAGNTVGDIGYAVQKVAEKYGYGYPRNLSGHGVGREIHEEPHVPNYGEPGKGVKLTEGLVIAIEPMFCIGSGDLYIDKDNFSYRTKDKSRTAHTEHTVIVGKGEAEVITRSPNV
jgi:methionyl aminopeptidase